MGKYLEQEFRYVGKTFPVHDAELKAKGNLKYTSDIILPNMLYAKLLLSPIAHGLIKKIDTSKVEQLPGVIKVFTYLNSIQKPYSRVRILPNEENNPEDQYLFTNKVRFVGDRVAAVVAINKDIAAQAIKLIEVEYEELPVLVNPHDALNNEFVKIHNYGNLAYEFDIESGIKIEDPAQDSIIVHSSTFTQKVHHAAMETHVCIADFDGSGKLTIWSPCQGAYGIRTVVADLLSLNYHKVRVIKTPMGGSFGGRQEFILEPLVAFIAKETRRPVKLLFDRTETIIATTTRPASENVISTAVTNDGKLLSCDVKVFYDSGAYTTNSIGNARAMSKKITRLYRLPYYHHHCQVIHTNTLISGGMRGWGAPKIITAMEIHMDKISRVLGLDPVDLRLKNLVHPNDTDMLTELSLGNARILDCLINGAKEFNWQHRKKRIRPNERFRVGVGLACAAHKNAMYGGEYPDYSTMTLKMNEDGTFILNTGLHELGCGTITSIQQITAEILEVDPSQIEVLEADTDYSPYDFGSYGSRVTYVCGQCAIKTAQKMKEKILNTASRILQASKQYLKLNEGTVTVAGSEEKKIAYKEIAYTALYKNNEEMLVTETHYASSNPGAYAAHFAEVEVDTLTGLVRVTDYLAVHDIGKAINPGSVEGQVQGSVQMGIGYALCEEIKINSNGKVITDSFRNYNLINTPDMPEVRVLLVEEGGDEGPFGAKSVGEIAAVPVAAAVVNAVNDALGTELSNLPLTPEKVLEAIIKTREKDN